MRIYCFEIDGAPDWTSGTPVSARDLRTSSKVVLYRTGALDRRRQAAAIVENPALGPARPDVALFSYGEFLGLVAPDEPTAAPWLKTLRAQGLFEAPAPVAAPPPPPPPSPPPPSPAPPAPSPPPPPPPSTACPRCGKGKLATQAVCAACARKKRRRWFAVLLAILLLTATAFLWGPVSSLLAPEQPVVVPVVRLSASRTSVKKGGKVVLSWETSGLTSVSIAPDVGDVAPSGSKTVVVTRDTTFQLFGTGAGYTKPATVTVKVAAQPGDGFGALPLSPRTNAPPVEPPTGLYPVPSLSTGVDELTQAQIGQVLDAWAAGYRANDPQRQAVLYAPHVDRFFLQQNVDNAAVGTYMTRYYARSARFTSFTYSSPRMSAQDDGTVKVELLKHFTLTLVSTQETQEVPPFHAELHLKAISGRWKITFERDFKN